MKSMQNYFFFPDRVSYDSPERLGLGFENVYFESADGTQLNGWFIPAVSEGAKAAKATVIHMHGNAQNMTAHWAYAQWLPTEGFNLFVFDYRGYGQSQGAADEEGVFDDAVAALAHLRQREDIDSNKLCVFGQSLGGMLAIAAAAASPEGVKAVLAEAPVHSYENWAFDMMPEYDIPTYDEFCASKFIGQLAPIPLLLIHSKTDKVVPYSHSELLFNAAKEPKRLLSIDKGDHNDAMTARHGSKYQLELLEFFEASLGLS